MQVYSTVLYNTRTEDLSDNACFAVQDFLDSFVFYWVYTRGPILYEDESEDESFLTGFGLSLIHLPLWRSVSAKGWVREGRHKEGWVRSDALVFSLSIFNSLEPYGVASSRQRNKQQFDARDQDSQQWEGKKQNTQERRGKKNGALSISGTEHIVIRCWKHEKMHEGKTEWWRGRPLARQLPAERGINQHQNTQRGEVCLLNPLSVTLMTFSIYKLSSGWIAKGNMLGNIARWFELTPATSH